VQRRRSRRREEGNDLKELKIGLDSSRFSKERDRYPRARVLK
jgi:hypothetical protein